MTSRIRYDTTDVDITERFAYWQDAVCDSYVYLGCDSYDKRNFQGSIEMERHSVLSISQVSGKAHRVRRRYRDIRRADDAYFLLSLQTNNTSRISQFEHSSLLNPGDMALYSSTEPYMLELSDNFSQTVVQLPKEKLLARLPNADMLVAQKIDGQSDIAKLVYTNIFAFSEFASTPNAVVGSLVQDTLIDMIATGLAVNTTNTLELSSPEQQVLLRAKLLINENFCKPELNRSLVANKLGASVRQLNRPQPPAS